MKDMIEAKGTSLEIIHKYNVDEYRNGCVSYQSLEKVYMT